MKTENLDKEIKIVSKVIGHKKQQVEILELKNSKTKEAQYRFSSRT